MCLALPSGFQSLLKWSKDSSPTDWEVSPENPVIVVAFFKAGSLESFQCLCLSWEGFVSCSPKHAYPPVRLKGELQMSQESSRTQLSVLGSHHSFTVDPWCGWAAVRVVTVHTLDGVSRQ